MRSNCGILAYDKLVGKLNGRTNKISLNTLAKIAQDNDFLLYPMHIPKAEFETLIGPFVAHYDYHFEAYNDTKEFPADKLGDSVYVLSADFRENYLVDEKEAKGIVGARNKWIPKEIRPVMDWGVPIAAGLTAPFTGGASMALAAGYGAARGWGSSQEHGMGRMGDILGGGLSGAGKGMLGAGLGGAFGIGGGAAGWGGAQTGMANYMKSMPFGQTLFGPAQGVPWSTNAGGFGTMGTMGNYLSSVSQTAPQGFTPWTGIMPGQQTGTYQGPYSTSGAPMNIPQMPGVTGSGGAAGAGGQTGYPQGTDPGQFMPGSVKNWEQLSQMSTPESVEATKQFTEQAKNAQANVDNLAKVSASIEKMQQTVQKAQSTGGGFFDQLSGGSLSGLFGGVKAAGGAAGAGSQVPWGAMEEVNRTGMQPKDNFLRNIIGQGVSGIGSLFKNPELGDMTGDAYSKAAGMAGGVSPFAQAGVDEANRVLQSSVSDAYPLMSDEAYEAGVRRLNSARDQEIERVTLQYNAQGMGHSSDLQQAISKINEKYTNAVQDYNAQIAEADRGRVIQLKYQYAQMLMGLNQVQTQEILGLTQLSLEEAAAKYRVDAQEIQNIRDWFGGIGEWISGSKAA